MIPVHIFGADLRFVPEEAAYRTLDRSEKLRASAISHQFARQEFVKTRALLRLALARCANRPPLDFTFATGETGKPYLRGDGSLHFNVSHSAGQALIAIASCEVGIDIERIDNCIDHLGVGATVFSRAERKLLANASKAERSDVFFSLWTRKEAYLKATGCGFSSNLPLISTACPFGKIEDRSSPHSSSAWYAFDLPTPENFRAALVAPARSIEISTMDISDFLGSSDAKFEEVCVASGLTC